MNLIFRRFYIPLALLMLFTAGCYEAKVEKAVNQLEIGMPKTKQQELFKDIKFIREQTVLMYPNSTESEMRGTFTHDQSYRLLVPEDLFTHKVTFDGNTKVYNYLIKIEKRYANPDLIHYIAVLIDKKSDEVMGWSYLTTPGQIENWDEKF